MQGTYRVITDYRVLAECSELLPSIECRNLLAPGRVIQEVYLSGGTSNPAERLASITQRLIDTETLIVIEVSASTSQGLESVLQGVRSVLDKTRLPDYTVTASFPPSLKPEDAARATAKLINVFGEDRVHLPLSLPQVSRGSHHVFLEKLLELVDQVELPGIAVDLRGGYFPSRRSLEALGEARRLDEDRKSSIMLINASNNPRDGIAWLMLTPRFDIDATGLSHVGRPGLGNQDYTPRIFNYRFMLEECPGCEPREARAYRYARMAWAYEAHESGRLGDLLPPEVRGALESLERRYRGILSQRSLTEWME